MDSKEYFYKVYGLKVKSGIEIEEFLRLKDEEKSNYNVELYYGEVSQEIKNKVKEGRTIELSRNSIWFHIENVATYLITNGKYVVVEKCENADLNTIKTYLMCSCLGFIMLQKEMVAIHGGTVVFDDKSIIFTGDRGAGKSTLTTALRLRGYKFIGDDVASTKFNNGPMISAGFPYQKLCEDAMNEMGCNKEGSVSFQSDTKIKYLIPAHDSFIENDVSLSAICEISVGMVDEVTIEELKGKEKLTKLLRNIYRGEFIEALGGMTPKYFKQCIDIAKYIKFYKITRPKEKFTIDEQINIIEKRILVDL